jgi:hypothetical protein
VTTGIQFDSPGFDEQSVKSIRRKTENVAESENVAASENVAESENVAALENVAASEHVAESAISSTQT